MEDSSKTRGIMKVYIEQTKVSRCALTGKLSDREECKPTDDST